MFTEKPQEQAQVERVDNPLKEISNAKVGIYKNYFGRGPTQARTHWAGEDTVVVLLEDTLTRAERNMVKMGEHQRLRDIRMFFQHASEDEFRGVIEEITGRKVRAFVSGIDTVQDVSSEVFYLEPVDESDEVQREGQ